MAIVQSSLFCFRKSITHSVSRPAVRRTLFKRLVAALPPFTFTASFRDWKMQRESKRPFFVSAINLQTRSLRRMQFGSTLSLFSRFELRNAWNAFDLPVLYLVEKLELKRAPKSFASCSGVCKDGRSFKLFVSRAFLSMKKFVEKLSNKTFQKRYLSEVP